VDRERIEEGGGPATSLCGPIRVFSTPDSIQVLRKSTLARNTGWMFLGHGLKLIIQALYFTVIARSLGLQNYGAFVAVVAVVNILFPFGTMGSGYVLVKNVARDKRQFPKYWGRALLTTLASSSILFGAVVLLSHFLLPAAIPIKLVMLVAGSEIFATNIAGISGQAFQAFGRLHWTAAINVMLSANRLAAALILVALYHSPSALQWGGLYFGSTSVTALIAVAMVLTKIGSPTLSFWRTTAEVREGLYFSAGLSAQTIYNDIDKTMLARLGSLDATGIYGAAYRLIDVSFAPVWSLLAATYPDFFRAGTGGITATLRYAKPVMLRALGYALVVCIALLAGAGVVPRVLGSEYRLTEEALRWLAVLPALRVIQFFLSDALTGAGYQGLRSAIHAGVALFNVLINLWIIPAYSWRGAAWSSIASDVLLAGGIAAAVIVLSRRSQRAEIEPGSFELRAEA
jgi:O-antigen/teichoic acid export membrane protein